MCVCVCRCEWVCVCRCVWVWVWEGGFACASERACSELMKVHCVCARGCACEEAPWAGTNPHELHEAAVALRGPLLVHRD